jgi:hypothetical protein
MLICLEVTGFKIEQKSAVKLYINETFIIWPFYLAMYILFAEKNCTGSIQRTTVLSGRYVPQYKQYHRHEESYSAYEYCLKYNLDIWKQISIS